MSSHSRPIDGIWTKWSITEIDENPTSSAARAMAPRRAAVSSGAPGQREATDLQSETQGHRVLLLATGERGRIEEPERDRDDRLVRGAVDVVEALVAGLVEDRRRSRGERAQLAGQHGRGDGLGPAAVARPALRSGVSTTTA